MNIRCAEALFIFFLWGACSCSPGDAGSETKGSTAIEEAKFVPLMTDIHIAEAVFQNQKMRKDTMAGIGIREMYCDVFNKHFVSAEDFNATLDYYTQHPMAMKRLYEQVKKRLTDERDIKKAGIQK